MDNVKQIKTKPETMTVTDSSAHLLNVKTLKTYQPVEFKHNLETFFTARRPGMEGMLITFDTKQQIIHIKQPGKDYKVVVPANVAYIEILE